ncbi:hypothetical protein D5086_029650 [Populus alba]|uniref:Uncharacterized protein n=1 Tax=Populus alba TaxID=43335 RepID=A0ACC4AUC1_POPAL
MGGSYLPFYSFYRTSFVILASPSSLSLNYIPDEGVRFILCAPNFGAAGSPRPLPATTGFALVVGGGAAMAAQGSSSSSAVADLTFKGLAVVFGCKLAAKEVEWKKKRMRRLKRKRRKMRQRSK